MEENTKVWNAVKQPPQSALRQIQGGRLKGKTDINPQWRYQVMTEQFGMCGKGWTYEVVRVWNEPLPDGQILAFAEIILKVGDGVIPGIGGSMLVEKEREGLHANDEGYKMAITDALSVAMKMLGVGADIYAGLYDGSKYKDQQPTTSKPEPAKQEPKKAPPTFTDALKECCAKLEWGQEHWRDYIKDRFGKEKLSQLTEVEKQKALTELKALCLAKDAGVQVELVKED